MRTTLKDVANRAGVSTATVSRVLNDSGYVSEDVRQRVSDVVAELDYQVNGVARSLRRERTQTLAIVVPDISNPYFMQMIRSSEEYIETHGYNILIASSNEREAKETELLNVFVEKRVDGILLAPTSSTAGPGIHNVVRYGIPVVTVDRILDGVDVDSVIEDNANGMYMATRYVLSMGHRDIAFINAGTSISTAVERRQGFARALQEGGIQLPPHRTLVGGFDEETGFRCTRMLMEDPDFRPTAILCGNNLITVGAMKALESLELSVPEDVSLLSFGELPLHDFIRPKVTSVIQNPKAVGSIASERLLGRINGLATGIVTRMLPTHVDFGDSVRLNALVGKGLTPE